MPKLRTPATQSVWFVLFAVLLTALGFLSPPSALAQTENGTVNVTLVTPAGIPASVSLSAKSRYVATKPPAGTRTTVPLSVAPGAYKVGAEPMTIDGQLYVRRPADPRCRCERDRQLRWR